MGARSRRERGTEWVGCLASLGVSGVVRWKCPPWVYAGLPWCGAVKDATVSMESGALPPRKALAHMALSLR